MFDLILVCLVDSNATSITAPPGLRLHTLRHQVSD